MSMELSILPPVDERPAGECRRCDILVVAALFSAVVYSAVACRTATAEPGDGGRRNVLFIAVDDLRTELGCYGVPGIHSPNIDALAACGTVFDRAYCQQAVCSPSRTSLMTGLRPDSTRVYNLTTHFRTTVPEVITLPQHFKDHGYFTQSVGKIYHGGLDDPPSWSEPSPKAGRPMYALPENQALVARKAKAAAGKKFATPSQRYNARTGPSYENADVTDSTYADGAIADAAIAMLRSSQDRPFFLAVGFLKPHLPFIAPRAYWDLYQRDEIPLAANPFPPRDAPREALSNWGELRAYDDIPSTGPLSEEKARILKHGYYACVSYIDAQLGRVLAELDRLQLRERTVIVLWGDHGWKLGEHGAWCKHTNFENDARVPLICAAPGQGSAGSHSSALVEFVDIYPTLCELAGLPRPAHLEGSSFAPLLHSPDRAWKPAAFSQYPRGNVMGYSMRTDRYRLTRWVRSDGTQVACELYDHQDDPAENVNIAGRPENAALIQQLTQQQQDGWQKARTAVDAD
jgi:iduronate 2-sulfatase